MRIIAGALSGRQFASPRGHRTHPMSDKVRGALFNILGDIEGLTVLDAFAGSGALGFEALSRGAASVTAVEIDKAAQQAIAENVEVLGVSEQFKLIRASAAAWLSTAESRFDLILLDPPYDDVNPALLGRLAERAASGGTAVISAPPGLDIGLSDDFELLTEKDYGDATLHFYRRLG